MRARWTFPLLLVALPSSFAQSPLVLSGSAPSLVDLAGNRWSIAADATAQQNGKAAGYTANVALLALVKGVIWQQNTSGAWYYWTGTTWLFSASNPLAIPPPAPATWTPTIGAALNLAGYHATFDWEANDFPNNPTPSSGAFTTTLSSGLRYLGNGDQQCWADSSTGQNPFALGAGVLSIAATSVGAGNTPCGGGLSYTSGVFTTQGRFSQRLGYFEARMKLPAGVGMWPAAWLLTTKSDQIGGWPPELDILEAFGGANANGEGGPGQSHWGVHSQVASQQAGGWVALGADATAGYHAYGTLWTAATISFVYDGKVIAQTKTPNDYTLPMYFIVNLAVGGTWPGYASGASGVLAVDYLRVFSSDPAIPAVRMQSISSPDGGGQTLYGASAL